MTRQLNYLALLSLLLGVLSATAFGFSSPSSSQRMAIRQSNFQTHATNNLWLNRHHQQQHYQSPLHAESSKDSTTSTSTSNDPAEVIAQRIVVTGDVQGGYYRACVKNEASRFRKLMGTMSPPDDSKRAEIYVEGKRKMVESFVRWCKRGDVGLSQSITVESVEDEYPTGLYDGFYVDTGRK